MHDRQPWVPRILESLGSDNGAAYIRLRGELSNCIGQVISGVQPACRLYGSWTRGDFHMLPSGQTLSDFDFIWSESDETQRKTVISELSMRLGAIGAVGAPKISVHPSESFGQISLAEQRLFNAAELAMGLLARQSESEGYVIGKGLLMLARRAPNEPLWDVASRTFYPEVFLMRLGCLQLSDLDERMWQGLLSTGVSARRTAEWAIANPRGAAEELKHYFDGRVRDTNAWIYKRVSSKLDVALHK